MPKVLEAKQANLHVKSPCKAVLKGSLLQSGETVEDKSLNGLKNTHDLALKQTRYT